MARKLRYYRVWIPHLIKRQHEKKTMIPIASTVAEAVLWNA